MKTMKRNAIFLGLYFPAVVFCLWFDPITPEPASDIVGLLIPLTGLGGLLWANAHSFASMHHWAGRLLARGAVTAVLFLALVGATYAYSWHIRPFLGLQCKAHDTANQASQSIGAGAPQTER